MKKDDLISDAFLKQFKTKKGKVTPLWNHKIENGIKKLGWLVQRMIKL
ncbi:MAG TPA: hypothetical protein VLZ83_12145 [Edaphocola sp.]|nr:hypothetical protein [Edaphocola sp.]